MAGYLLLPIPLTGFGLTVKLVNVTVDDDDNYCFFVYATSPRRIHFIIADNFEKWTYTGLQNEISISESLDTLMKRGVLFASTPMSIQEYVVINQVLLDNFGEINWKHFSVIIEEMKQKKKRKLEAIESTQHFPPKPITTITNIPEQHQRYLDNNVDLPLTLSGEKLPKNINQIENITHFVQAGRHIRILLRTTYKEPQLSVTGEIVLFPKSLWVLFADIVCDRRFLNKLFSLKMDHYCLKRVKRENEEKKVYKAYTNQYNSNDILQLITTKRIPLHSVTELIE